MKLGNNILKARKQLRLSQEQLGAAVGVTRQTISNWELNETVPDARQLLALSQALNISMDALVDNEERPVQTPEIQDMESRLTQRQSKKLTVLLSVVILLLVLAFISAS